MLNFLIAIIVDAYAHVKLTIEVQGMLCAVRHYAVCDGLKLWADMPVQGRKQHHDRRSEVLALLASAPSTFVRAAHKCTCELTSVG